MMVPVDSRLYSPEINQAAGMVSVQAMTTIAEAIQLMRSRAAKSDVTLEEVARAVIDRTIRFDV
jgi:AmiR/NasT family two-component response regulator